MKKTQIQIDINNFPDQLHYIFENTKIYDSSSHPTMTVLYSENGYYIKIGEKGTLTKEAELTRLFQHNKMGVEVVSYISDEKDYMVTRPAKGEDCTHYLSNPERLCEVLADTMKFLHSRPVAEIPVSLCMKTYEGLDFINQDTFIHGDFCLPNIILDDWKFSTFIDVGLAGIGDKHIDIYWALWSLEFNLKTDKYSDYFLSLYGKENYDKDVLKKVAEIESQA